MDRMWLTRADRMETIVRGLAAGSIAGALLAGLESFAAVTSGHGALLPWRMAASVLLEKGAFAATPAVVLFVGLSVHAVMSISAGVSAAMLSEWSEASRRHRLGQASASLAGAVFGGLIWFLTFPMVAANLFPWIWRLDQGVQLALHLAYGAALGLALNVMGRHAHNPPDSVLRT